MISVVVLCMTGCGPSAAFRASRDAGSDDGGGNASDLAASPDLWTGAVRYHFVVNKIFFPLQSSDYAVDLNGDGFADNQLGNIMRALAQNLDVQGPEDLAVIGGTALELLTLATRDDRLLSDPEAAAVLSAANPQRPPDFSGNGSFSIDRSVAPGSLAGALVAGNFTSAPPVPAQSAPIASLRLVLVDGAPIDLPLVGGRLTFRASTGGFTKGQLNGALRKRDVAGILIPALAANLTLVEHRMPCDTDCTHVRQNFDLNGDGSVSVDEVAQGPVLERYLLPDVQLFDASDRWLPNPSNVTKDSLSIGLALGTVKATFDD